ncbi:MAG: hypothetical protein R3Y54_09695 [Eubacteriales bacterium]
MEEAVLSTYIKIMQEGFVEKNKQESATRFLLDSIINQDDAECTTDITPKKISNLVNRKESVPSDIKKASANQRVMESVRTYFAQEVIKELNPNSTYDIFNKIYSMVQKDTQISKNKRDILLEIHRNEKYDTFLAEVFLYVLSRENKKICKEQSADIRMLYRSSVVCEKEGNDLLQNKNIPKFIRIDDNPINKIYKISTKLEISSDYDDEGIRKIIAQGIVNKISLTGEMSVSNWFSRSYINNCLTVGTVECRVWFEVLSVKENKLIVQFLLIGDNMNV